MAKAADIFTEITNQIIESIESGQASGQWTQPWANLTALPYNAVTGKTYQGGNTIILLIDQAYNDRSSAIYATYKQWESIGAQVRKGEHGISLVKWTERRPCKTHGPDEACDKCFGKPRLFPTGFTVFSASQVDGYQAPVVAERPTIERIEAAEAFFAATGLDIRHGGDRAYYAPVGDYIQIPEADAFLTTEGFYSTLGHESIHATGHSDRLDRQISNRFGDEKYAAEELVAELGAAFLCVTLGITNEPRADHGQYLASWLKVLRADSRALFTAAGLAQKAVNFLTTTVESKVTVAA